MPLSFPSRGRVLAVDDSSVIREILIASLEAAGYSVEALARCGGERGIAREPVSYTHLTLPTN